uniref:CBY1 interacting BAR domain containing 2 n=2 Tax=Astyanax mexicanus TaxID=7994 RepID=A0A3B1J172_ASTMX
MTSIFSRETQLKAMEATIDNAEKYMGQFCTLLAAYSRKTAKLRDKADMLTRQLHDFACTEDPEMSICLKNFSEDLSMVQDYRQAEVERLDARVVTPLKAYGDIVKTKRADLKKFSTDRNKELKEVQRLEKLRLKNPADRQGITQAEVNVQRASSNASRSTKQMEETIIEFQRQKLEDVKMFRNRIQVSGSALENTSPTADMPHYPSSPTSTLRLPQYSSPPPTIPRMAMGQHKQPLNRVHRRQKQMEDDEEEDDEDDDDDEEERFDSEEDVEEPQTHRQSYAAEYVATHRQK